MGVKGIGSLRLPSEPARPREMKLSSRLRLGVFGGGEGGVMRVSFVGRPASGWVESTDHLEVGACSGTTMGGRGRGGPASGEDTEGTREMSEALWVML